MKHLQKFLRTAACIALIAVMLLNCLPAKAAVAGSTTIATSGSKYTVIASTLNFRSGPGTGYSVITGLRRGTTVTFLSNKSGWWRVRTSGGQTGYVDRKYLAPASTSSTGKYFVTADVLRIRKSPTTSSSVVGKITKGTIISISQLNGDWGYVSGGAGAKGWVALKYVSSSNAATGSASTYTVTADILNVRASGSTGAKRIDKLTYGTVVKAVQVKGNWVKVAYTKSGKMREGWVSHDYLRAN